MKKLLLIGTAIASLSVSAQAQTAVTNGSMALFRTFQAGFLTQTTLTAPNNWNGIDSFVFALGPFVAPGGTFKKQTFKTTDKYDDSLACRIETRYQAATQTLPGILTNGQVSVDITNFTFATSGGQPINNQVASVNAWVKYYGPTTADSGDLNVQAVVVGADGSDSIGVGSGNLVISQSSSYKYISAPVTYSTSTNPNRLRITFGSNSITSLPSPADDSSALTIDDVTITDVAGITEPAGGHAAVKWYPNPANEALHLIGTTNDELVYEIYNVAGQLMARSSFTSNTTINTASYATGAYFYAVKSKNGAMLQQGHILVQH